MALVIFQTRKDQNRSKFKEKIQHYQFDLTFYEICTSCFIFQLSIWSLRANDCEIFSVSYGIAETRNGYNSKWPDTNFAALSYYKVRT